MNRYDDVDKVILGEIYSSSECMKNLEKMCDDFGSRFPGTTGDRKVVEYMVNKFKEYGLIDAYAEEFTFPGWIRGASKLEIVSPIKQNIDCIALPGSPNRTIEATLIDLGDGPIEIYEKRKDEIKGNVVIVTSKTPRGMARPLHRTEKLNRSILSGASGFIFMNHYPAFGPPTGSVSTVIPSVGISYEEGKYLLRSLKRFSKVKVKISTQCENRHVTTWNVIADLHGTTDDEEYVVVGAHYEGHDIAVGAIDSGSGASIVLELARVLSRVKENIKRRIRFICFSAEEIGLWGSKTYVKKHKDELKNLRFMFNLDAAGGKGEKGVEVHGWQELEPYFNNIAVETNAILPVYQKASPYSDHWPFLIKGVPTASMGDPEAFRRRGGRGYGHTRFDTVDKIDIRYLWEAAANGARILLRVANSDDWPVKQRKKDAVQQIIEEQGYNETLTLIKKLVEYLSDKRLTPEVKTYLDQIKDSLSLSKHEFQI
jgi:hypothetical protein